ncbi:FGGY-family carbohydrate kinase [Runella slithyformis]|uniref:Carbohydrate kinase, FGGY n=1 Tax=Runella slithyformis (strain ATCC 29530 / DSM 19594 / LMG 11500 / NCIMB 11436 / LSU 4) TaxID=761193 RepID=A0A7U4E4S6_RUNSL|nr:FGGY family carbohydrate kinase [Runella slithyformis]AEI47604.1 Carbohydrate kinase, FGGY [Runella slithyformis DSM 19594]
MKIPVCAVLDIGKTNKKLFLFDETYKIVLEKSGQFPETTDEDDDPCEDVALLTSWVIKSLEEVLSLEEYDVKAINFSTYGASLVHVDESGAPVAPLYNYLKPYPEALKKQFYATYGGEQEFTRKTASPILGSLNSAMIIYRLKYEKPELFFKIKYSLHLPQYVGSLVSGLSVSDITSIGCHTNLWDFDQNTYHAWVAQEGILGKLAPIEPGDTVVTKSIHGQDRLVGIGLHDSSSALIPYLVSFLEPFVLISTGTWCISLNPFNHTPLTDEELQYDCLCYMQYNGKPVKASRLFAGYEHEQQTKRLAAHFDKAPQYYKTVAFNAHIISELKANKKTDGIDFEHLSKPPMTEGLFGQRDLASYDTYEQAYHQLILDIVNQQIISTGLVLTGSSVKRMFVDGGFGKNPIYMNLLAAAFPDMEIFAASVAQATSLGAALSIHRHWNTQPLPPDLIDLRFYNSGSTYIQQ